MNRIGCKGCEFNSGTSDKPYCCDPLEWVNADGDSVCRFRRDAMPKNELDELKSEIAELKNKVEAMRNCWNCEHEVDGEPCDEEEQKLEGLCSNWKAKQTGGK